MPDSIRRIDYYYTDVPDRPGEGAKILNALKNQRVNLLVLSGFPQGRRAQIDFVPANKRAFLSAARKAKVKLVGPKTAFFIQGVDRPGEMAGILSKLAQARINVTSVDAVSAGRRRYGAILWVKPRNVNRTAQVLGAK
jgi:hypothetical protein